MFDGHSSLSGPPAPDVSLSRVPGSERRRVVIPANPRESGGRAGIQDFEGPLDSRLRGNDARVTFQTKKVRLLGKAPDVRPGKFTDEGILCFTRSVRL